MTTPKIQVYFAGLTGPDASGGEMAISFTLLVNGKPVVASAQYVPAHVDGSWHTATYLALEYAVRQCHAHLGASPQFLTDNQMVSRQMAGIWKAKDGHYWKSRENAIRWMERSLPAGCTPKFECIARDKNLAVPSGEDIFKIYTVKPWSYKHEKQKKLDKTAAEAMLFVFMDGTVTTGIETTWSDLKEHARTETVQFRIAFDENGNVFHLGPDMFKGSFRLCWTTPVERNGGKFMDHRVRSNEPDDFLSRIGSLVKIKAPEEFAQNVSG